MIRTIPDLMLIGLAAALISSCATDHRFAKSETAAKIQQANERYNNLNNLFAQADTAFQAGDSDEARRLYGEVLQLDPNNPRALTAIRQLDLQLKHAGQVAEARQMFEAGDVDGARLKLRPVLVENPSEPEARALLEEIEAKTARDQITPRKLKPPNSKTVTLEFRDASLQNIFEVISKTSGINFVFDPTLRTDLRASIFVKDASVEDAIDFLLVMHQLNKKVLTENSLLIYPSLRANQYEDLILRTFYLNHADAKQTAALIKQMLPVKDAYVDDKLNMVTLKATYDQLKDAERLIANEDMPDPEVMLDVEVLEVRRSRLTELGITYPNTFSIVGANAGFITWHELTHVSPGSISVAPSPTINLLRQDGDTNLLANPRIRVMNREKARIHIGDRIPIITTTISSSSNFASQSANYLDVGLKLDVEPRVMLNSEVSIKLSLEVSSATQAAGATFPTVNTRNTSTVMMAADGETQVLAGLINDEDRKNASKVPGLSDLPILGRIFTNKTDDRAKTEIVLLITPHVVRNIALPRAASAEFYGGTAARSAPMNINPTAVLQSLIGVPLQPAVTPPPGQTPAPGQTPPPAAPAPQAPAAPTQPGMPSTPQPLGKPIGTD